jgi:hypothetical protein
LKERGEREEEAMGASADQVPANEVPAEQLNVNKSPDPLNISSTQPPSTIDMTQGSTTMLSQMLGEVRFLTHVKIFSYYKQECFTDIFSNTIFYHRKLKRAHCHDPMDLYLIRPSSYLTSLFKGQLH